MTHVRLWTCAPPRRWLMSCGPVKVQVLWQWGHLNTVETYGHLICLEGSDCLYYLGSILSFGDVGLKNCCVEMVDPQILLPGSRIYFKVQLSAQKVPAAWWRTLWPSGRTGRTGPLRLGLPTLASPQECQGTMLSCAKDDDPCSSSESCSKTFHTCPKQGHLAMLTRCTVFQSFGLWFTAFLAQLTCCRHWNADLIMVNSKSNSKYGKALISPNARGAFRQCELGPQLLDESGLP